MLKPCLEGINVGLMSEAGCPGIADPGAAIAKLAHENGIQVVPMVGPSSILLGMMASGLTDKVLLLMAIFLLINQKRKCVEEL